MITRRRFLSIGLLPFSFGLLSSKRGIRKLKILSDFGVDPSILGGIEAVPIVFDNMEISTPLLHGELFPFVTTKRIMK